MGYDQSTYTATRTDEAVSAAHQQASVGSVDAGDAGLSQSTSYVPELGDMPPAWGGQGEAADDQVRQALTQRARDRMNEHESAITNAVLTFKSQADTHIQQLVKESGSADADVDGSGLVGAFLSALGQVLPGEQPWGILETLNEIVSGAEGHYAKNIDSTVTDGALRLSQAANALVQSTIGGAEKQWKINESALADRVEDVLSDLDTPLSTDKTYIDAACDYLGIPSAAATFDTVRQSLELEFFGLFEAVHAQILGAHVGADPYDYRPSAWEHDAREEEQRVYERDHEDAWSEVYEETLELDHRGGTPGSL